jgi:hypothetical protein
MGKVCQGVRENSQKKEYTGNAKKKKGKAAPCNDCKAAGGNCFKLENTCVWNLPASLSVEKKADPQGHPRREFQRKMS